MKFAFFSNFLNHHQLPLCEALYGTDGVEFTFVACEKIPEDRLAMGYEDMNTRYPFAVRAYEDEAAVLAIAESYDAVIFGACPTSYIAHRMKHNRLSFRFCERSRTVRCASDLVERRIRPSPSCGPPRLRQSGLLRCVKRSRTGKGI